MDPSPLTVLAIDDHRDNLVVLGAVLADRLPGTRLVSATSGREGLALARDVDPDVVLLDIVMPGMDGYAVCRAIKDDPRLRTIPVLFLTAARGDRASRVEALEAGAEGFLAKPFDEVELTAQIRAMAKVKAANRMQESERDHLSALVAQRTADLRRELAERQRAAAELRVHAEVMRHLAEGVTLTTFPEGTIVYTNPKFDAMFGYAPGELIGRDVSVLKAPGDPAPDAMRDAISESLGGTGEWRGEVQNVRKDGTRFWCVAHVSVFDHDEHGRVAVSICTDITERKRAERERESLQAQLVQAQKMESVGRLAGGVAHDFNNMLGVILGHADLALMREPVTESLAADLQEIRKAAERSANLTRQLLAFAREQAIAPVVLDLDRTVEASLKMLRRLIGEDVELVWRPGNVPWPIRVDPSQVDQVLINLCVNARDAITGFGHICIETGLARFDEADCAERPDLSPGEFVKLAVSDDGCGMDGETLGRIFEPFFTTKEVGKGTGLGLSLVYGVAKQNRGLVLAHSHVGRGSTFEVYFPRHADLVTAAGQELTATAQVRGHETILIVEDEPAILRLASMMLMPLGYEVLVASSPGRAIDIAATHHGRIHLLITDVVMPGMNGRDLARGVQQRHPGLRCLFMSGYSSTVISSHGVLDPGVHFLPKPFTARALAAKVREALDNRPAGM